MAWRVTPVPSVRRVIETGPSADRRPSRLSRVASPSAANTGTASVSFRAVAPRLRDIPREILDLPRPPLVVHAERLGPAGERDPIEAGLDDRDGGALLRVLEHEFDERGGLG